jgi:peptidyl-prolyl cis-trans isomerase D
MAVLEKIRSRMGILVSVVIGISLIAFILTDMFSSGSSVFSDNQFEIAEISGKSINVKEYEEMINQLSDVYKFNSGQGNLSEETVESIREQTWQTIIDENVLGPQFSALGLQVSSKEVLDMVQGSNPHQYIRQLFTNPETKEFNRSAVIQFIKNLEANNKESEGKKKFWLYIENQITKERIQSKYYTLIRKGLYVTSAQQAAEIKDNNKKVTFSFVNEPFTSISDSSITVKESELEKYLKAHENEFQQEASRDIEYITYDIVPSQEDFLQAQKWINDIHAEFVASTDIKQFVKLNSDISLNEKFLKESELPDTLKRLFSGKTGESYGPYFEDNTFKIARLVESKNLSDSVKASHILIKPAAQTKEAADQAKAKADSLLNVIKKGGKFDELAKTFSTDGSASNGGDLGWFKEGAMVKPFNDACFNGKKGDVLVVESQFGYHVIEITDKGKESKKVQIGVLAKKVEPSNVTLQAIYQKASSFAGSNNTGDKFASAIKKDGITPKSAAYLNENMKSVQGIDNSRELIRWAFKAEENTISGVMEFGNVFVIARLSQIREKGTATLKQVKDQITLAVKKEKKAEQLIEKLNKELSGSTSIEAFASKTGKSVQSATDVTFSSYSVPGLGFEPAVIATATNIATNKVSAPIKGENGVFVLAVNSSTEEAQPTDPKMIGMRMASMYANRVNYEAFNILKKMADIKDERTKFY